VKRYASGSPKVPPRRLIEYAFYSEGGHTIGHTQIIPNKSDLHIRRPSSIHKTRAGRTPLNQVPDQALSMAMLFAAIHKIASTINRTRNARQRKSVSRSNCADSRASKVRYFSRDSGSTGRSKTPYSTHTTRQGNG